MIRYLLAAYLIGSIPAAYLLTRWFKGKDIRLVGSQNAGTTNVLRQAGRLPGLLTLIVDMAKGYCSVLLGGLSELPLLRFVAPAFAIAGHNWPVWLRFRGGGGLATFIGASLAAAELPLAAVGLVIWGLAFLASRSHDLSAVVACVLLPVLCLLGERSLGPVVFSAGSSLMILLRRLQSMRDHALQTAKARQCGA